MENRIVHPALLPETVLPPHLLAMDFEIWEEKNWFLKVKHIFNEQLFCIHAPPTMSLRNSFHPALTEVFRPHFSGHCYARCQQQSLPHLPGGQQSTAPMCSISSGPQCFSPPPRNCIPRTARGARKPQRGDSDQNLKADNF